jgi:hypothetical protein
MTKRTNQHIKEKCERVRKREENGCKKGIQNLSV